MTLIFNIISSLINFICFEHPKQPDVHIKIISTQCIDTSKIYVLIFEIDNRSLNDVVISDHHLFSEFSIKDNNGLLINPIVKSEEGPSSNNKFKIKAASKTIIKVKYESFRNYPLHSKSKYALTLKYHNKINKKHEGIDYLCGTYLIESIDLETCP